MNANRKSEKELDRLIATYKESYRDSFWTEEDRSRAGVELSKRLISLKEPRFTWILEGHLELAWAALPSCSHLDGTAWKPGSGDEGPLPGQLRSPPRNLSFQGNCPTSLSTHLLTNSNKQ